MQIELDDVVEDAVMGSPEAHLWLASEYKKGGIVNKDLRLAWHWTKKASDEGSSFATLMLGFMYYKGQGVTQDFREAARLFKTASKEQSYAWMMLGVMNMDGIGVRKRQKKLLNVFHWHQALFQLTTFAWVY